MRTGLSFLIIAASCLLVGVGLGMYMGIVHDFTMAPVHAHLNLLGWASCAIFGLTYRAFPELEGTRLAKIHLALSGPSAVLFPLAIHLSMNGDPALTKITAPMWLFGVVVFLVSLVRLAKRTQPSKLRPLPAE